MMKVSAKGQVTIPQRIRQKFGITPKTQMEFIEEKGRVYLVKKTAGDLPREFAKSRGIATVKMTTDEIMALTRID
jgi:AbrB family looped-hinge helix DNA binding protein